jgi:hypothetical protein
VNRYLTASLRDLPTENRTTRRFGILMLAPVWGFRAVRALRCDVLKVPNPTNVIDSPFFNDLVMPSSSDAIAAAAPAFEEPVSAAILAMSACLFRGPPQRR